MTDPAILRELFEACKSGDLVKVKKLLTPHNVNEIGMIYEGSRGFFIKLLFQIWLEGEVALYILRAGMVEKMSLSIYWQMELIF